MSLLGVFSANQLVMKVLYVGLSRCEKSEVVEGVLVVDIVQAVRAGEDGGKED